MNIATPPAALTPKDFTTDQEVRWCPGCGDYAILKSVRSTLADLGVERHNTVFISGIGCAARFPYYMETYGFHTIHGRAPAIATGLKLANPDLDIWVISGDGDALSIGGNHLLHVLRRNVDLQFLLFNNEIYGLTKGQYSPTSRPGTKSPSTPFGSVDNPVSAASFALGSGGRFIARSIDTLLKHMPVVLKRAHTFKGAAFVEIFQNCLVYNDATFSRFTDRALAADNQIDVIHGQPLIFGRERDKGLRIRPGTIELEIVTLGENGITMDDILVHDETSRILATMLVAMDPPSFPVALGVIYCDPAPSYVESLRHKVAELQGPGPKASINDLLRSGHTWQVS
jgi:2-oxoglutarate ferredoxin oxidoreductase subunit beta